MPVATAFQLLEEGAFGDVRSWRLKGNYIRFAHRSRGGPWPARKPVVACNEQIARFVELLNFLEVWDWRTDYSPQECGYEVADGMSWSFTAQLDGRACCAGGWNAYPSFADVKQASLDSQRYLLLVSGMHWIFQLEPFEISLALEH